MSKPKGLTDADLLKTWDAMDGIKNPTHFEVPARNIELIREMLGLPKSWSAQKVVEAYLKLPTEDNQR